MCLYIQNIMRRVCGTFDAHFFFFLITQIRNIIRRNNREGNAQFLLLIFYNNLSQTRHLTTANVIIVRRYPSNVFKIILLKKKSFISRRPEDYLIIQTYYCDRYKCIFGFFFYFFLIQTVARCVSVLLRFGCEFIFIRL